MKKNPFQLLCMIACTILVSISSSGQLFPNGDFELGPGGGCQCPTNFTCGNDAGRVVDGTHPVWAVGNNGCVTGPTNFAPQLGAHGGTSSVYFYAGADNFDAQAVNFVGGEEVCLSVWYCGPQGSGASGQNTANSHFSFKLDGVQIGPDVQVPTNTPWTEHTFTVIMTPGAHTFGVLSGGAAQYSIWFDDFNADLCSAPCDPAWTSTTACSADGPINLDALITGDTGGTWSGTGVTGNSFDPSNGTQAITYTAPGGCDLTQDITVTTSADATWVSPGTVCATGGTIDLNTTVTGTAGGSWSGTGVTGSTFDPSGLSGSINITYTAGTAPCDDVSTQAINVTASSDASWTTPGAYCEADGPIDLNTLITGDTGGSWSGTGVTGSTFDPTGLSGNISITYSVGAAPCDDLLTQDINVVTNPDPSWTPPSNLCDSDAPFNLNTTVSGTSGGTWSGTGVTANNFDPSVGTQTITYTVGSGSCQQTSAQTITVGTAGDPSWTNFTLCASDAPVNLNNTITGDPGGTWSGTGVSGNVFDPFFGTQTVTYTVGTGSCQASSAQTITVIDPQINTVSTNVSCFGLTDGTATATATGTSGSETYSWNTAPPQNTANATGLAAGTYIVTVTDGTCSVTDTVDIIEPAEITGTLIGTNGCEPNLGSAIFEVTGGVGGFTYAWNNSTSTSNTASDLDSNMHVVTATDNNGCTYTDSVLIQIFPSPIVQTIADTTVLYGDCVTLTTNGASSYSWTPATGLDCADCSAPEACPTIPTTYCVEGIDTNGCASTDCVFIDVEIVCGDVFVPSAFSPNDDGDNDLECVYSDCVQSMTFTIYNRWGEKVFETNDMTICWDGTWNGKELNSAVFVYLLEGTLINGETVSQKGNISLIR